MHAGQDAAVPIHIEKAPFWEVAGGYKPSQSGSKEFLLAVPGHLQSSMAKPVSHSQADGDVLPACSTGTGDVEQALAASPAHALLHS